MAEKTKRTGFLQTLRQGWRPAKKRTQPTALKPTESTPTASQAVGEGSPSTAKPQAPDKPKAVEKPTAPDKPKAPPTPNMQERMEGLQGWMAEIERKQGRMTYFGAALALLAVAAAGAALYFAVTTKNDSATKGDVDEVTQELEALKQQVSKSTQGQASVGQQIQTLQSQLDSLTKKQAQDASAIADLKTRSSTPAPSVIPAPSTGTTGTTGGGAKKP